MSSVLRRLRRVFSASRPAAAVTAPTTAKVKRHLESLVQSLKPPSGEFRSRPRVLEAVRELSSAGHAYLIEEILREQKQRLGPGNEQLATYLIGLYGVAGLFDHALKLFDEMPDLNCPPTIRSLNSLLQACVNSKRFDEVEELFQNLPVKLSLKPDIVTYNTLVGAYCWMGSVERALLVIDEISKNGLEPDHFTFTPLLVFYYRSGRFKEGDRVWDLMESKNVSPNANHYHIRLHSMVSHDKLDNAIELFAGMEKKNVQPDTYCYNALIFAFCRKGDAEETKKWYRKLVESDCSPDFMTISMLIPFFRKKNDLEMAYELCADVMNKPFCVAEELVQSVINDLVRRSKMELAEELVKLSSSAPKPGYNLKIPSESES